MDGELNRASSHRFLALAAKFHDKQYRDGYVAAHNRRVLADQMRNFRGGQSQAEYAAKIEKQKTVVGRLENPAYGGWSLRTMLEVARRENVAILVRFVDFPTFLSFTDDLSGAALHPKSYETNEIDRFAAYQSDTTSYYANNVPKTVTPQPQTNSFFSPFFTPFVSGYGQVYSGISGENFRGYQGHIVGANTANLLPGITGYPFPASGTETGYMLPLTAPITMPPTPIALRRAHDEIRRLDREVKVLTEKVRNLENEKRLQSVPPVPTPRSMSPRMADVIPIRHSAIA